MFAFSPDRHAVQNTTSDASRRFVRTGVAQPGTQPASQPVPPATLPFTAPSEPVHERAYPQADGEP